MSKIQLALRSRTFWTIVAMFVINGLQGVHGSIPPSVVAVLDPILSVLAIYFHVNPSQNYSE